MNYSFFFVYITNPRFPKKSFDGNTQRFICIEIQSQSRDSDRFANTVFLRKYNTQNVISRHQDVYRSMCLFHKKLCACTIQNTQFLLSFDTIYAHFTCSINFHIRVLEASSLDEFNVFLHFSRSRVKRKRNQSTILTTSPQTHTHVYTLTHA